jgi:hypothetical protein
MDYQIKSRHCAAHFLVAVIALGGAACSQGGSASHGDDGTFDDTAGALVAHLKRIPENVRCVEIQTSDWRQWQVLTDVQPGSEATIRIAPLLPGYLYFSGAAYDVPCWQIYSSEGGPWNHQTWIADNANVYVQSGNATPVTITFRRLGSADVSVDFADGPNCDAGPGWEADGGPACPQTPGPVSPDAG